jgi:ABC-type glycerol-3-phosphate transport system substrate-binding protein
MSLNVIACTFAKGITHARKIYLTAFWRLTPVALLMLIVLTTACGSGQTIPTTQVLQTTLTVSSPLPTSTSRPVAKATPTATQLAVPTLPVDSASLWGAHIRFWYVLPGGLPNSAPANPIGVLVDEFNRSNTWGVTVEAASYESYEQLIQQVDSPQGGDLPNLLVGYPYQLRLLDETTHTLVDMTPYVQDPRWGMSIQEQDGFNPLFWEQDVVLEKRLGLPFFRSAQVLYYNLSQARELGFLAPPATPSEFSAQACAAAQSNGKSTDPATRGTGGWAVNTDVPTMEGWLYAFGSDITGLDDQSYTFSSTQTTQALTFLKELSDKGCAWSAENAFPSKEFASRRAIFIAGSLAGLDDQAKTFIASSSQDNWTVIPFPSPHGKPVITVYGPSFALLKSSPEKQVAAWLFARWMVSPQNQANWIENNASLPLGAAVLPLLDAYKSRHPQWAAAVALLPDARLEPHTASWDEVRWSLNDAGGRLFSPLFPAALIPQMVGMLSDTAAELGARPK